MRPSGACPAPRAQPSMANVRSIRCYPIERCGYSRRMEITTLLVAMVVLALIGELFVWLQHRKDVAEPPSWN